MRPDAGLPKEIGQLPVDFPDMKPVGRMERNRAFPADDVFEDRDDMRFALEEQRVIIKREIPGSEALDVVRNLRDDIAGMTLFKAVVKRAARRKTCSRTGSRGT